MCDEFYERFKETSKINTETYDKVFKCIPSDNIRTYGDFATYCNQESLNKSNPYEVSFSQSVFVKTNFNVNFFYRAKS